MPKDGSGKGNKGKSNTPKVYFCNWDCFVCGVEDNRGSRTRCRNCGAYPRSSERRPIGGKGVNGDGGGKGGGSIGAQWGIGTSSTTLAARQILQQNNDAKLQQQARELADARRLTETLREQNRKLQKELAEAPLRNAPPEGEDMEGVEGLGALSEAQRQEEIVVVSGGLPYLEKQYGKEAPEYQQAVEQLEKLRRAQRDAKPYKTHRAQLERRLERLRKQQDSDKQRLEETQETITSLQKRSEELGNGIKERDREIEAADAELKELLQRAMGKGDDDGGEQGTGIDPATSWNNVVRAASSIASHPAIPREWAAQLEGLFEQLRTVVSTMEGAKQTYEVSKSADKDHGTQLQQQQAEQRQLQEQIAEQRQQQQALQQQLTQQQQQHQQQQQQQQQQQPNIPSPPSPIPPSGKTQDESGSVPPTDEGPRSGQKPEQGDGGARAAAATPKISDKGTISEDELSELATADEGAEDMELDAETLAAMEDLSEEKKKQLTDSLRQKWKTVTRRRSRSSRGRRQQGGSGRELRVRKPTKGEAQS